MFTSIHDTLLQWFKSTNDRRKLQHSYLALALSVLLIAGLAGLIDYGFGQMLLQVVYVLLVVFVVNAVIWALLESFVFSRLGAKSRQTRRK